MIVLDAPALLPLLLVLYGLSYSGPLSLVASYLYFVDKTCGCRYRSCPLGNRTDDFAFPMIGKSA